MTLQFKPGTFDSLSSEWAQLQAGNRASQIFSTGSWSKTWWQSFGTDYRLLLGSVVDNNTTIGIVPLKIKNGEASFIGSSDVCDYLDFIVAPGKEKTFFPAVLDLLKSNGITSLHLAPLRPDSSAITNLSSFLTEEKLSYSKSDDEVSIVLNLPPSWESYLSQLERKQRFELKRKLRRLEEAGAIRYRTTQQCNKSDMELFFTLFRESRTDKAEFLTPDMESFFRTLMKNTASSGYLNLNFLELNGSAIASTLCFDYNNIIYLYNSGYNPDFSWLSAGLLSKAKGIQESIINSRKQFDFLKGNEKYKYHLGGREIPLYKLSISSIT